MFCECGCGGLAPIAPLTSRKRGWVKDQPIRFIHNHHHRLFDHEAAFWAKVDKTPGHGPKGECWIWTGSKNEHGYGSLTIKRRRHKAHRVAYILSGHSLDDSIELCHRCDYPPCVRPDHMFTGTHAENMADSAQKGRFPYGERHHNVKLTDIEVVAIRDLVASGTLQMEAAAQFGVSAAYVSELVSGHKRGLAHA